MAERRIRVATFVRSNASHSIMRSRRRHRRHYCAAFLGGERKLNLIRPDLGFSQVERGEKDQISLDGDQNLSICKFGVHNFVEWRFRDFAMLSAKLVRASLIGFLFSGESFTTTWVIAVFCDKIKKPHLVVTLQNNAWSASHVGKPSDRFFCKKIPKWNFYCLRIWFLYFLLDCILLSKNECRKI